VADLIRSPVYKALTQPQMFAGVTYTTFIINAVVTTETFLVTRSFYAFGIALLVHLIAYVASLREPRILDLWLTRVSRCPRIHNFRFWRCNSYAP
jgi:type IV secretion system protein VirB3